MNALRLLRGVPLLGFALIAANLLALLGEGFHTDLLKFVMPSGDELVLRAGDLVVLAGLVLLYIEIFKLTRANGAAWFDNAASIVVFVVALLEFLLLDRFAHASMLALLLMCLIDVIAGLTLSPRAPAARDDAELS